MIVTSGNSICIDPRNWIFHAISSMQRRSRYFARRKITAIDFFYIGCESRRRDVHTGTNCKKFITRHPSPVSCFAI